MLAVAQRWLAARKLTDAPSTVDKLELAVRVFGNWLGENHPKITTFADVTRDHCLGWIGHIAEEPTERTGKPLGVMSRIQRISGLSQFFRDTAIWQYADVPGYTLIGAGDAPKFPQKVPNPGPEANRPAEGLGLLVGDDDGAGGGVPGTPVRGCELGTVRWVISAATGPAQRDWAGRMTYLP
jgi:hypothetical protein